MIGGTEVEHSATRAHLLKDAYLIDGVLYQGRACDHLYPRRTPFPRLRIEDEIECGAIYSTASGNRWFGQWLMDDVLAYALAENEGVPVCTNQPMSKHALEYERLLGMEPERVGATYFREAIIFEDIGQSRSKQSRFRAACDQLCSSIDVEPHPGVFLMLRLGSSCVNTTSRTTGATFPRSSKPSS
jgi:hypothetical protein